MKVALIQMNSTSHVDDNLDKARALIERAALTGAKLVVLPEMFACIGVKDQVSLAIEYFSKANIISVMGQWAKDFNVFIVAGSVPYLCENNDEKVLAACFVLSPAGQIISQYNKVHLFDVFVGDEKGRYRESDTFIPGNKPVVVEVEDTKLGLSICYDLRFPELYQAYQKNNCQLITVPSAFTYETGKAHWEILLRARAIETQSYILAANQGGVHDDGRRTWGRSMVVAPDGKILAKIDGEQETIVTAELDFEKQASLREAMPLLQHKKL